MESKALGSIKDRLLCEGKVSQGEPRVESNQDQQAAPLFPNRPSIGNHRQTTVLINKSIEMRKV